MDGSDDAEAFGGDADGDISLGSGRSADGWASVGSGEGAFEAGVEVPRWPEGPVEIGD
jgi:hypothetical protein